jgi:large subunit ribosomal protein L18
MAYKRKESRIRRHTRVRKKVIGSQERPRLVVYRSLQHIYTQIIDDSAGHTLVSACSLSTELRSGEHRTGKQMAFAVGKLVAEKALAAGIKKVCFDRGGLLYHGRVAEVARGAREGGLEL